MREEERTRGAPALRAAAAIALAGVVLLPGGATRADYEAVSFGVNEFDTTGCDATDSTYADDYIALFYSYATSPIYWNYDYVRPTNTYSFDGHVDARDLTDYDRYNWGADDNSPFGSDFADAIFLATHGKSFCMELSDPYYEETGDWRCCGYQERCDSDYSCVTRNHTFFWMGDDDDTCYPRTNDYGADPGHILLGDADANVFLTTACSSLVPCTWEHGGYSDMDAGSFNTYMGFYGSHNWQTGQGVDLSNYFAGVTSNNIGSDWLSDMFVPNGWNPEGDNCPMVNVWCSSTSNCSNQYNNGGFKDFKDTGTHSIRVLYWVGGCDPNHPGYDLDEFDRPALPDL